jgi:hypothetical protein
MVLWNGTGQTGIFIAATAFYVVGLNVMAVYFIFVHPANEAKTQKCSMIFKTIAGEEG